MSGIPNDPTCSICESLRTIPLKGKNKVLTDVTAAWCALHERKLFEPQRESSISFTVCSRFKSVYRLVDGGKAWPPPPSTGDDHDHLWLNRPSNERPYWTFQPLIRFDELPKVDPETGGTIKL